MSSLNKNVYLMLLVLLLTWLPGSLCSGELEISSSPSPVGSGARAAGMAEAFVAVADDATAASWNPAGLVQLERPEISIVGSYSYLMEWFDADYHEEFETRNHTDKLDLNYLSFAYPVPFSVYGHNVCLSLNYQKKYDFNRSFHFDLDQATVNNSGLVQNDFQHYDFAQRGGLSAITPAIALELSRRLSIGASFNIWHPTFFSENSWEQVTKTRSLRLLGSSVYLGRMRYEEHYESFTGQNMTLGLLWNPVERWSVGMRYDTAFTGKTDYSSSTISGTFSVLSGKFVFNNTKKQEQRLVHVPDSLAFGIAWRPNDRLTLSMDVTRTDWNDFHVKTEGGKRLSLVDSSNLDNPWTRPKFRPTYTARLGAEYVFVPQEPEEKLDHLWSLRTGFFWDEEPASGKTSGFRLPGQNGSGKPDTFYGCAFGVGLLLKQHINIDAACQVRYGPDVNRDFIRGIDGFKEDVVQMRFLLSTVIYF